MSRPAASSRFSPSRHPLLALWMLALAMTVCVLAQTRLSSEARIKAAYVLKFSQYVSWPEEHAPPGKPLRIGVMQESKILADLLEESQSLRGRSVEVIALQSLETALECHIVYIGSDEVSDVGAWVQPLKGRPILLVSDLPLALEYGLTIRLVEEAKSLRFDVNQAAAEACGLKLDPQMLRYARSIQRATEQAPR